MTTGEAAGETAMRPLAGVRVVELGIWVAAPAAAAMLADWGADIVKVEPPGGDPNRRTLRHVGEVLRELGLERAPAVGRNGADVEDHG